VDKCEEFKALGYQMKGGKVEEIIEQTVTIVGELENWREFE
jgi:hypothetical protein